LDSVKEGVNEVKPILQVEDDPNDVFFLKRVMERTEMETPVRVAVDGQEAIDYLKGAGKFADRGLFPFPCLVLLDLKLPYVMGLDVLKWIRSQPMGFLPVIIFTASAEPADVATAYRLGATAFLTKPSETSKLEGIVRAIKEFWLIHNRLPPDLSLPQHDALPLPAISESMRNHKMPFGEYRNGRVVALEQKVT
jgi:CheY-like chemotaxis protein